MAATLYNNFSKPRMGWFLGFRPHQVGIVAVASLPVWASASGGRWGAFFLSVVMLGVVAALTLVPIGGRSAFGWLGAMVTFTVGSALGWSTFTSRAARGQSSPTPDLPGPLADLEVIDGPPSGPEQLRIAIVRNPQQRRWAVTARLAHPGIGMAGVAERDVLANAIQNMLDTAAQGELVDECHLQVRMSPEDGVERERYLREQMDPNAPEVSQATNIGLLEDSRSDVTPEVFFTVCVTDAQLKRLAGTTGTASQLAALVDLTSEVSGWLGGIGCTSVQWLTSPQLAAVIRTGFCPSDAAAIKHMPTEGDAVGSWGAAGPSRAKPTLRAYTHDRWATITATTRVPDKGAVMGSIAPLLVPATVGERRCLVVVFQLVPPARAARTASSAELLSSTALEVKSALRVKASATDRIEHSKASEAEYRLATGGSLVNSYVVAAVTAPADADTDEVGRRFDASMRSAGYHPQRLDIAHDLGFVAACLPLGVSLGRA